MPRGEQLEELLIIEAHNLSYRSLVTVGSCLGISQGDGRASEHDGNKDPHHPRDKVGNSLIHPFLQQTRQWKRRRGDHQYIEAGHGQEAAGHDGKANTGKAATLPAFRGNHEPRDCFSCFVHGGGYRGFPHVVLHDADDDTSRCRVN